MKSLIQAFSEDREAQSILAGIASGMQEQLLSGLVGSSRQVMIASLYQETQRPLLVVTNNMYSAQKMIEDLQECLPEQQVLLYPANELTITETSVASPEILGQRLEVLSQCARGFSGVIVAPLAAIRKYVPIKEVIANAQIHVEVGQSLDMPAFLLRMHEIGYERVDRVENRGEYSVRGGIIDLFPLTTPLAYRLELFDDEIDSIRMFDAGDQRSREKITHLEITPCREIVADSKRFQSAAQAVYELLHVQLERMNDRAAKEKLESNLMHDIERLREGQFFREMSTYVSLLYPERHTLLDYLDERTLLLLDEPMRLMETSKQIEKDEAEMVTTLVQDGRILPALPMAKSYEGMFHTRKFQTLFFTLFLRQIPHTQPQNIVNFVCRAMQNFHGQMNVLKSEMERWDKSGANVMILAGDAERMERVRRILEDYKIKTPNLIQGNIQSGFEFPAVNLVVITEGEIFSQKQRKARKVEKKIENAERIRSYLELKVGDYVVHVNHGIGRYEGIGTLVINGIHKDYMHIVYAGGDKLSVPIDQIDLVQKYVGSEDKEPKLYKLGGTEWAKVKKKARSSVKDIADDLIKLYAARQASKGYAFSKDTPYQKEFESMFAYEETPDQLRSIEEIKKDMEKLQVMDRLLCGDVGYGKTEVAVRAAFKAAMDGKQVAVLVPTTILAQQHYETFRERFADYPVAIEVLSRFRSKKEQSDTLKGLKTGAVDIVIGTHRLLSKSVKFKEIGLLIVDEEQRFGVSHKEKLKQLKTNVDVLTLTATPIPRTLHMSILGVRDLSVIETPPENRFPVQTYVVEHSPVLIRESIEREMARNGQVYYLFNRVQGIYQMAEQISDLVPDARVAVCHGQMSEQELESTILDFLDGQYDVLVSTTIIETGVDIPNVNTLIVHDADKMGLSQLYQLRGRVGRSNRIAYAYFTYQKDKVLNEVAEKRLQAIKEFTELGSGFKIAMRDLAIRGAGNLLGAQQHGFIVSVGFDLYSQMLAEEVAKRKKELDGQVEEEVAEWMTQLELEVDAYLPSEYIYDSMQKIEIYKKVAGVRSIDEANDLIDELVDRFGDVPQPVFNLLTVARLKVYGQQYLIRSISQKNGELLASFEESPNVKWDGQQLLRLANRFGKTVRLLPGKALQIAITGNPDQVESTLETLEMFLKQWDEEVTQADAVQHIAK